METSFYSSGNAKHRNQFRNAKVILMAFGLVFMAMNAQTQTFETAITRWSTFVGGAADDRVLSIALDGFGYVYVTGRTSDSLRLGNDTSGISGLTHQRYYGGGNSDAFLAKYHPQGAMLWCTYFGGTGDDEGVQVVIDLAVDEVYLVGNTTSPDSIATDTLAYQSVFGGGSDLFIARFTEDGLLLGASYFGGQENEFASGAALDVNGRLVVCGYAEADGAFAAGIVPQQPYTAGLDGLLLLFDGTAELLAGSYLGGEGDDRLVQVAEGDPSGIVLVGNTNSSTGIATLGAITEEAQGGWDAFLMRVDSSLVLQYGSYFGGEGDDEASSLIRRDTVFAIAGSTNSEQLYTNSNSHQAENAGGGDGFLAVLNAELAVQWCTFIGDSAYDALAAVRIDDLGAVYVAGTITSSENLAFPIDSLDNILNGPQDAFLMHFSDTGAVVWSRYVGSMAEEEAGSMAVKGRTTIYLGGRTSSTSGINVNPHQPSFGGGTWDGFTRRLDQRVSTPCDGISGSGSGGGGSGGGSSGTNPPQNVFDVCLGDSIMFVAYGGALGFDADWMWYEDHCGLNQMFLRRGDTLLIAPTHSFTLYVRAEGSDHTTLCKHAYIVVHEIPEPVAFASDTVCAGSPIQLNASGSDSFTWMVGDSVIATGANAEVLAPMEPGPHLIELIATNGSACDVSVSLVVEVLPEPGIEWQVTHIGCEGEPGMIELFVPDSAATNPDHFIFAWEPDTLVGSTISGLSAGAYTVTVTDTVLGCTRSDSLVVLRPLSLDVEWELTAISCEGDPGSIQVLLPDTAGMDSLLTITWEQSGLEGFMVSGLSAGSYIVSISDTLGCTRTDTLSLFLPPIVEASWLITATTCHNGEDGSIALQHPDLALSDTAFLSIAWSDPELLGPELSALAGGLYTVILSDTTGCSRTDSLVVTIPPALVDSVSTTFVLCDEATGTALVLSVSNSPGLAFDFGSGPDSIPFAEELPPGNYTLIATDSIGCELSLDFTILSLGNISVSTGVDTLMAENGITTLGCYISPPDPLATFHWSPAAGLEDPTSASTNCSVSDTTVYVVLATSGLGCIASDTVVVVPSYPEQAPPIIPCGTIFIPDHFSPNDDGQNDLLCLMGGCVVEVEWLIQDRWGGRVFSSSAPDECWDGTYRGAVMPTGTYVYTLRVLRSNGEELQLSGTITLLR